MQRSKLRQTRRVEVMPLGSVTSASGKCGKRRAFLTYWLLAFRKHRKRVLPIPEINKCKYMPKSRFWSKLTFQTAPVSSSSTTCDGQKTGLATGKQKAPISTNNIKFHIIKLTMTPAYQCPMTPFAYIIPTAIFCVRDAIMVLLKHKCIKISSKISRSIINNR